MVVRDASTAGMCEGSPVSPLLQCAPGFEYPESGTRSRPRGARVPPRSSRLATEVERLHAGLEALRRQELETPRARQTMKQRWPAASDDRMNDDAVLVDEPQLLERGGELGSSDEDAPL